MLLKQNSTPVVTIMLAAGGTPVTGLVAADVACYISKNGAAPAAYSLVGKITEQSAANMPGLYKITFTATETNTLGEWIVLFKDPLDLGTFDQYAVRASIHVNLFDDIVTQAGTTEATILSQITTTGTTVIAEVDINEGKLDVINANIGTFVTDLDAIKGVGFLSGQHSLKIQGDKFDVRVPSEVALKEQLVGAGGTTLAPVGVGLWDILGDGTTTIGDIDLSLKRVLGLVHENFAIRGQTYDGLNNLVSAVVKIYPTKADTLADTNELSDYTITAAYDAENRLTSYTMVKN